MEDRMRFVMKVREGGSPFAEICRQHGISRDKGYKWWRRYREGGVEQMAERSRRPLRSPGQTSELWRHRLVEERKRYGWGPKKLWVKLCQRYPDEKVPSVCTLGRVLWQEGLVEARRCSKRRVAMRLEHTVAQRANEVWAADFKGWFRTGDGCRCDPLTVSDLYSRYVLCCQLVKGQNFEAVKPIFQELFARYGMPGKIRCDNGSPFGTQGLGGWSQLSLWWLTLGIGTEFIQPSHPEQNGIHERMHRNLKPVTRPAAATVIDQQKRLDQWRRQYNTDRPHEALKQQVPADFYSPSQRKFQRPKPPNYPFSYIRSKVDDRGRIRWNQTPFFIGKALSHQTVGIKPVHPDRLEIYLRDQLLGHILPDSGCRGLVPCNQSPLNPALNS